MRPPRNTPYTWTAVSWLPSWRSRRPATIVSSNAARVRSPLAAEEQRGRPRSLAPARRSGRRPPAGRGTRRLPSRVRRPPRRRPGHDRHRRRVQDQVAHHGRRDHGGRARRERRRRPRRGASGVPRRELTRPRIRRRRRGRRHLRGSLPGAGRRPPAQRVDPRPRACRPRWRPGRSTRVPPRRRPRRSLRARSRRRSTPGRAVSCGPRR